MIIVSHRGPYTFAEGSDGRLVATRGAGGVVSALSPLMQGGLVRSDGIGSDAAPTWIAAAIGPGDERAARTGAARLPGIDLVLLDLPAESHRLHYDVASNEVLWFLHHQMLDPASRPDLDAELPDAWDAYRSVNQQFADAVCERAPEGDLVFVQDYQLALVPAMVRAARPDLRTLHFSHIPFCDPADLRALPEVIVHEYLGSLAQVRAGFHSERWRTAYEACSAETLGTGSGSSSFIAPLGPDPESLRTTLATPEAAAARVWFNELAGDCVRIVRTDRVEPTKNLALGFAAYESFLDRHPEWRERVVFVACSYRSRQSIPRYQEYTAEVDAIVERVNERFGVRDWQPIVFDVRDNHTRSMVALEQADITFVNPLRDGLNLVAMESAVMNARNGVVICSTAAGAYDVMAPGVLGIDPRGLDETTAAIAEAVTMDSSTRASLAHTARTLAARHTPRTWLEGCLAHAP